MSQQQLGGVVLDSLPLLFLSTTGWATLGLVVAGLVLMGATVSVVLRSPVVGVLALTVFLPANALITMVMRANDVPGDALVGAFKDMVLLALLIAAVRNFARGRRWTGLWVPGVVGAILVLATINALMSSTPAQTAYGWRNNYFPLLLLVTLPLVLDVVDGRRIARWIVGVVQAAAVVTIATWMVGDPWLKMTGMWPAAEFPWALVMDGRVRGFSPFSSANTAGVTYGVALAVLWTVLSTSHARKLILSLLPLAALGTTLSRSAVLGLLILGTALLARAVTRRSQRLALSLLGIVLVSGVLAVAVYLVTHTASELDRSFVGHFRSLAEATELMRQSPWGVGVGSVGPRALRYDEDAVLVESFLLLVALEAGWLMLALWLALLASLILAVAHWWRTPAFVTVAALLAASVSLIVLPAFQEGPVSYFLWISCAIGLLHVGQVSVEDPAPSAPVSQNLDRFRRRVTKHRMVKQRRHWVSVGPNPRK